MGNAWLFVVTSFLLAGPLSGQETNFTSGCLWDNTYSLSCTSAGIKDLHDVGQESKKMPSWPRSPRLLKTIKDINLSNNMMSSLHMDFLYKFSSLETLNVSNNYISMVSMNSDQEGKGAILASLHTLVIDKNRLSFVPRGLGKLPSLQTLHLSANIIVRIQKDDFSNCTQLQTLDLGDNRIHKIDPDAFRDLRNLQVLRLSNNALVSITPLVFLYSHVLRADIDLSHNRWACDCRILPLKHLLTSLPVNIKREWNVTCSTPLSRTGNHLLSIGHINGSCQSPGDKYIYATRIRIPKGETTYLPCNITDKNELKKAFWWTPQGIISGESSVTNHYIDRMNNLILTEPDHSHEGLYLCIADMERIVYQVHLEEDAVQTLIRRPRDVQPWNTKTRTEEDFSRAVALSVVISFICAFILGVFLRPCLEKLWKKLCKSKDSKKTTSTEAYDNEGFSAENVAMESSSNGRGSNLPVHGGDADIEDSDGAKYVNVTYNEREIYFKNEQVPIRSELQERGDIYDDVEADHIYMHATENSKSTNPKRVTWAVDEESSPKVNLKHAISLLKPLNFIVPETQMENTNIHDQSIALSGRKPENVYSDTIIPKENTGSLSYTSSDESEFWDAEDLLSDEDTTVNVSTQQVGCASNGHVIPTVNLRHVISLLKPINFVVPGSTEPEMANKYYENLSNGSSQIKDEDLYDISLSGYGSSSSVEDHSSEEDAMINIKATEEIDSPKVNLKHVMSLIKPINIIVPEVSAYEIVKSPTKKQIFPIAFPRFHRYKKEYSLDTGLSGAPKNHPTKDTISKKPFYQMSSPGGTEDESHSYHSSASDDGSIDFDYDDDSSGDTITLKTVLLPTKQAPQKTNADIIPTVNLQQVISLLKPINIIAPEPSVSEIYPCGILRQPEEDKKAFSDSSSSEDESEDEKDHSLGKGSIVPSLMLTKPATWENMENTTPTVNLKHLMSLIKPINITIPELTIIDQVNRPSQIQFIPTIPYNKTPTLLIHDREEKKFNESSSSDDGSEFDYDSSDEDVKHVPDLPPTMQATLTSSIDTRPTVNLQQVISLLKPINIIVPNSEYRIAEGNNQSPEPKNHSPNLKYENIFITSTRPIKDMEGKQTSLDSSSSDDESKEDHSSDKGSITPSVSLTKQPTWTKQQKDSPTVNLRHVMSLIKPINITIPEYTKINLENSPSQTQFFPGSISRYPEHRMEDIDMKLSGEPEKSSYNSESYNKSPTLPVIHGDEKKTIYDSSSSDDTEEYSSDEEVKLKSSFPPTKQTSLTSNIDTRPTVNLHQVIALLKPINIVVPKFENRMEEQDHFLKLYEEPVIQSPSPNIENSLVSSIRPTNDTEGMLISSDSSSSDDESEEDNSSDKGSIIPSVSLTKQESWAEQQNSIPIVNLKHVMSLIKPINITIPDATKIDQVMNPIIITIPESPKTVVVESLPQRESSTNQSYSKSPILPVYDGEEEKTFYDSSSSDDTIKNSSDEEVTMHPGLLLSKQPSWTGKKNESPKVNLQQLISMLKPIRIIAPDYSVIEPVGSPTKKPFFPTGNTRDETGESKLSAVLPNDKEDNQSFYDSSSSEDESKEHEDHSSDEGSIKSHDLLITEQPLWTREGTENPKVNLQQIISLFKPIHIIAQDYSIIEPVGSPIQNQFFPTGSPNYETESSSSEDESKEDKDHSSDEGSFKSYDLLVTEEPLWTRKGTESPKVNLQQITSLLKPIKIIAPDYSRTKPVGSPLQNQFFPIGSTNYETESSSSEDESKEDKDHSSDEGSIKSYDLLITEEPLWIRKGTESPKVNLQQVISLLKPIRIMAPDYSVIEPIGSPLQNQFFPIGSTNYEAESSSSEDESKKDEDHSSDEGSIKSYDLLMAMQATRTPEENERPTVNFKRAVSLVRPISIIVPEYMASDNLQGPTQKQFFPIGIPKEPEHKIEDIQLSGGPEYKPHHENNETHEIVSTPKEHKEIIQRYESSSSEDESKKDHGSVKGGVMHSYLPTTKPATWPSKEIDRPSVNLKHLMSLVKPMNIVSPEPMTDLKMYHPHYHQYIKEYGRAENQQDPSYGEHYLEILTRPKKHEGYKEIIYDSTSSGDDSDKGDDNHSYEVGLINPDLLLTKNDTWPNTENINTNVNLKSAMSLVKPIGIKVPDSTVTEALRRFKEKYNIQVRGHQTLNQLQNTFKDPSVDKLNSPKTIQDDVSKHFVYGMSQDSDDTKVYPKLLSWEYNENSSHKVNLNHAVSLLKPINIIAPDSIEAVKSPEQKYLIDVHQPGDKMEEGNTYHHHYDHDNRIHRGNSRKHNTSFKDPNSSDSEVANTLYDRSVKDDSIEISFKEDIRNSAHLTPISSEDTSLKLNLKQVISLLKPISIAVPDSTSPDPVESRTKELVAERLSHNTISEYYTDNFNDSSSDDGSFFSFTQSNSLSDDSEKIAIARAKVGGLKKEMDKSGKNSTVYPNPNTAQRDEGLKDFAGGRHEPNKAKDVLHWLNTNTNVEPNHEFPASKTLSAQIPEQELVFDLNTQEWTQRSIVREEPLIMPTYQTQMSGNKNDFLQDFGETSTDTDLLDSNDSLRQMDAKLHKVVSSATVAHSRPKHHTTNKKKVFDAFSETLKEESV